MNEIAEIENKNGLQMFAELVSEISSSTKTNDKLQSLVDYFATAPDEDKVWVIAIFSGRRPRRAVNSRLMREWCLEIIGIPDWLCSGDFLHERKTCSLNYTTGTKWCARPVTLRNPALI